MHFLGISLFRALQRIHGEKNVYKFKGSRGTLREAQDNYGAVWPQENAYLIDFKITDIQNGLY